MTRPAGHFYFPVVALLFLLAAGIAPGSPVLQAQMRINELMSSNGATLADENGDSPDWFELFNAGADEVDLSGWGMSDDARRPFRWVFREARLQAGEFLVVYASGKDRQPQAMPSLDPATLAGLQLWLRADAVNPGNAAQVRRAGNWFYVRRWVDSSGRGNHAQQTTDANQPLWVTNGISGRPALRFDGNNDLLTLARPLATNSFCLFAVYRTSRGHETDPESGGGVGGVSGQRWLFGAAHGGDANAGAGVSVGTNGVSVYEHGSGYMPALAVYAGPVGTNPAVVAVNYDAKRPALDLQGLLRRDGVLSPRRQVTAPVEIGSGSYGAFQGDLAEVLLYDRPLTVEERRGVARYLADRYALPLEFPLHTNFQLGADGEELWLTRPDGSLGDAVRFGPIARDVSFGRQPDGQPQWVFFPQPTPGHSNVTPGALELLASPAFSHPGGFYTNAFDLALTVTNADAQLRYTLDGSLPTEASLLYTKPLLIRSRAGTVNTISMIPTVPGGSTPQGEVFKGWVVRARAFKPGALPSEVVTRTFWVDTRGRGRITLPVVSLATDAANLFDANLGIYVPGNAPGGNYSQRGPEWERPAHVELYETDNQLAFGQAADVKIHGNTSQGFPIKGLDLDGTGGGGRRPFRYRLFPDRDRVEFEHFLLRPTGHDQPTAFMRDELMQSLGAETGAESQAARPCVVFVNGEYWGLHYLKEKEDTEFVSYYGDVPADAVDYLEGYAAAKAGDTAHYDALIAFVAANSLQDAGAYAEVQSRLEVPNYIDYKVCEIFFYRWDIGNHRLWRPRTPEGRWRWLQFDNDVGWGGFWAEQPAWAFNMLEADLTPSGSLHDHNNETTTFLLRRLIVNPEFRRDFINRFCDLLNTTFQPTNTVARINGMADALRPEMAEHIRRWRSPANLTTWTSNIQYLRDYANRRPDACRQHLRARFGLGTPATLTVTVSHPAMGRIRVNSIEVAPPSEAPWSGVYFRGQPTAVTALPAAGCKFAGWDGLGGVETNSVTLVLNGEFTLGARFVVDPASAPRFAGIERAANGVLYLHVRGPATTTWTLETSTDLATWAALRAVTLDSEGKAVVEQSADGGSGTRWYRLAQP